MTHGERCRQLKSKRYHQHTHTASKQQSCGVDVVCTWLYHREETTQTRKRAEWRNTSHTSAKVQGTGSLPVPLTCTVPAPACLMNLPRTPQDWSSLPSLPQRLRSHLSDAQSMSKVQMWANRGLPITSLSIACLFQAPPSTPYRHRESGPHTSGLSFLTWGTKPWKHNGVRVLAQIKKEYASLDSSYKT